MATVPTTVELVVALARVTDRAEAARQLAARLGVETLLLFVRDPELGALIPATGFPQTLNGGPRWREFLARCANPGRHAGDVDLPSDARRPALALVPDGIAAVLIGGTPIAAEIEVVSRLLPMLSLTLHAEQRIFIAEAQAAEAKKAAGRSEVLAAALESARAEASGLVAQLHEEHVRKDDFLAMLAHELRNPLTPLVTSIDLLRQGNLETQSLQQLDIMARQLGQLSRLVEDLLDVSRVSRGRIELRRAPLLLQETLSDAVEASRPLLDARALRVELALGDEPLRVHADAVRLAQIFSNILHNAAKYTDPGGRITISVGREGDEAIVKISDTGMGISADMLPRVFDLFAQAPVSLSRAQGGLGIGLTLVRALVELHGGSVSVESPGIGEGSTFRVRLPLLTEASFSAAVAPMAERGSETIQRSLRILVVDDNKDAADSLAAMLRFMGHHPEVAYSGLKALQLAADLDADLMLIDIGLPELDGYEVARRLRRLVRRDARLVALTGYGSADDKRRSREAGFDEHIVKPVMMDVLQALTERAAAACAAPTAELTNR